ncbi:MAG: T9SS type A sorting domain-containing protein [Bacteroidia bacterium]
MIKRLTIILALLGMVFGSQLKASGVVPVFFSIRNVVQTTTDYSFDVYAETTDTFMLNTYQIYIAYNTAAFGSSVVTNNNFSNNPAVPNPPGNPNVLLYDSLYNFGLPFSNFPKYKIVNIVDNTANILAITVDTRIPTQTPACLSDSNKVSLFEGNIARPLVHVILNFTNNTQPPGVSLYLTLMVDQFIGGVGGKDSCNLAQGDPSILPATFSDITASYLGENETQVDWEIASEQDVVTYEVEKSIYGEPFAAIGSVKADALSRYSFIDKDAEDYRTAYRIRAVNQDGNFMYSEAVEVVKNGFSVASLYPNPSADIINVKGIEWSEQWQLRIIGIQGNVITEMALPENGFSVADLPAGMYFAEIQNTQNNSKYLLKFQRL